MAHAWPRYVSQSEARSCSQNSILWRNGTPTCGAQKLHSSGCPPSTQAAESIALFLCVQGFEAPSVAALLPEMARAPANAKEFCKWGGLAWKNVRSRNFLHHKEGASRGRDPCSCRHCWTFVLFIPQAPGAIALVSLYRELALRPRNFQIGLCKNDCPAWAALADNVLAPDSAGETRPGDWPHVWQFHASHT